MFQLINCCACTCSTSDLFWYFSSQYCRNLHYKIVEGWSKIVVTVLSTDGQTDTQGHFVFCLLLCNNNLHLCRRLVQNCGHFCHYLFSVVSCVVHIVQVRVLLNFRSQLRLKLIVMISLSIHMMTSQGRMCVQCVTNGV